jgi:hypothetical protein
MVPVLGERRNSAAPPLAAALESHRVMQLRGAAHAAARGGSHAEWVRREIWPGFGGGVPRGRLRTLLRGFRRFAGLRRWVYRGEQRPELADIQLGPALGMGGHRDRADAAPDLIVPSAPASQVGFGPYRRRRSIPALRTLRQGQVRRCARQPRRQATALGRVRLERVTLRARAHLAGRPERISTDEAQQACLNVRVGWHLDPRAELARRAHHLLDLLHLGEQHRAGVGI